MLTGKPALGVSEDLIVFYSETAYSRVLLGTLILLHIIKKFPISYRTRKFMTVFTRARHCSACARLTQPTPCGLRSYNYLSRLVPAFTKSDSSFVIHGLFRCFNLKYGL
jgi:hypothetical protein